jgi:hypothetical protein
MELPKTKDPEKWIKDVALSKSDFMDNNIAGEDMESFLDRLELGKPVYKFENGKAKKIEGRN